MLNSRSLGRLCAGLVAVVAMAACQSAEKGSTQATGIKSLAGTWQLQSIENRPVAPVVTQSPNRPSLTIAPDGKVSGSGGVNRLMSSLDVAALSKGTISMKPVASTMMAGPPEFMDVEGRFTRALGKVNNYQLDGGTLSLRQGSVELLKFTRAPASAK